MTTNIIIAICGLIVLLAMVFMGVHIAVALGTVGFVGSCLILGVNKAFVVVSQAAYYNIASFDFAVIPLFVLMGMMATAVGVSTQCYDTLAKWLGRVPGGLGVATTCACAAFGTLNGSALVTGSVFAKVAGPEMTRYGYSKNITYGLIAAAGNIGQLIPPSVLIVIFGALSGDSIGRLLMAGISPGLGLTLIFSLTMVVISIVSPKTVPVVKNKYTWGERFRSLVHLIPIAIVALIIVGGLFGGVFSSSEAGAIGCLVFFVYALIFKTPIKKVWNAIMETITNSCMMFLIIACSGMFAKFMTISGMAGAITNVVTRANLSPTAFLIGVAVVLVILGCFLDATSCISLTLPMFQAASLALGIDPMQFAMVMLICLHMGGITPPVGLCVYCVKSVAPKDVSIMGIFKGAMPFLIGMIVLALLFIFFPVLSTMIPDAMM